MSSATKIPIKNSIATRMLLVVLGLYLLIAVAVTLSLVWMDYNYQKENIIQDLGDIENAFKNGLAVSLWDFDEKTLKASVEGMLRIPQLVGVKIRSDKGATVAMGGIVTDDGETGSVALYVNLSRPSDAKTALHRGESYKFEMFEHQFSITYNRGGKQIVLGKATIYSNSSVIYRKMKVEAVMLVVYVILTLFTFSMALLWAFNRYLRRPLGILTDATAEISLSSLGTFAVDTKTSGRNEIKILEKAMTDMVSNLHQAVSKQEKAELAMKQSEALYRSLVENIDMGIVLMDKDYNIVMANAAQGRMLNKSKSELIGKKCFQEFEKKDHICSHCPGVIAMETGRPGETMTQGQRDDGSAFTVNIKAFPLQGENGENKGFIEVVDNITEQLKTQRDLAAEKERLAVTLRSIGDGVITADISGNVVLLNKVAEKLTGWTSQEAVGRPLEEVFHLIDEQTRKVCENPVTKVINSGLIVTMANHTVLVAKDGIERNISDSGAPILNARSNIIGAVLVFRDVTEKIKTDKELLKVKKLESIGVLAGGIAHDFNNILASILGNINLALVDEDMKDNTRRLLSEAEKASIRAKDLTQQLLTFSKGGEPIRKTSSLGRVIKDSSEFVLHGDKVACRFDIPEDLWLVDIDQGQMSQVIQNMVLNASHAMPEGGSVKISCENIASVAKNALPFAAYGRFVKLCIKDSGIGMPANVVEKIFDPYYTTKQEGSGLGLAICQAIISKHNGYILVESAPGVGSTFMIYLPASEKTETRQQKLWVREKSSLPAKILIMDDEEMVRSIVQAMLVQLGHEVDLAEDGQQAITSYQAAVKSGRPFDLVIMDLTIPGGMGGKEAVREILNIDPNAKVIVSSGYSNDPIMASFKDFGFCYAIAKPYQLKELSEIIDQAQKD